MHTETTEEGQAPAVQYDRHGNPFPPRKANDRVSVVSADIQLLPRLKAIWQQRELLMLFIRTDLKVRYKESILGYFWSMLNPALVLAIYYVIFRFFMPQHDPQLRHLAVLRASWCGTCSTTHR